MDLVVTKFIAITYEATFFRRLKDGQHVVIQKGLPFTVPEGDITMVLEHIDGSKHYADNLVTATVYEDEPRPTEPEAQSFYDRVVRNREEAAVKSAAVRKSEISDFFQELIQTSQSA